MSASHSKKSTIKAGFLIHDASRLRRTVMDQHLKPLGITRSQWWVLSQMDRDTGGGFSQVELARLLDVGKVTLGGLIDRLETNGLVTRVPDEQDRRAKRVKLSRKGRKLLERIEQVSLAVHDRIMDGISAEEERQLITILTKMKHNLKAMDAVPASTTGRRAVEEPEEETI
jgi:MarR family transcriptional regulator, transcriptional regulator for hemolysin